MDQLKPMNGTREAATAIRAGDQSAFTAIAEPRRREILGALAHGRGEERDVTWLVRELGWPQPQVSKHLGVLRKVGLVAVARRGKHRMYSLEAHKLRPVYDWVKNYERFWENQLQRIKARAERMQREAALRESKSTRTNPH